MPHQRMQYAALEQIIHRRTLTRE